LSNLRKKDVRERQRISKEPPYQPLDILVYIAGVILLFAIIIILWPKQEASAGIIDSHTDKSLRVIRPLAQEPSFSLDECKLLDSFKNNPKDLYILKNLTLQNYIWQYLTVEMDLSDEAAAGIFGNMMVECGGYSFNLQPYIYSTGGYYYGLCQWSTTNHHSGIRGGTLEQQLEYLHHSIVSEMGSGNYDQMCQATTPGMASVIFARWYERCADPYGRQECAERAYERFSQRIH